MWRKNDPTGDGSPTLGATDGPKAVHPAASPAQMARIGGSLAIKGDLYGEEDLFIEGTIEGKITVKQGSVTQHSERPFVGIGHKWNTLM